MAKQPCRTFPLMISNNIENKLDHGMEGLFQLKQLRTKNNSFNLQRPNINQGISSASLATIKSSSVQSNYQSRLFPSSQT